ncbi:MBL fold metallo-hydrolase [Candidatus Micrarchaeota archaeon]|nr:MBL fold metallo-hydrolase [Candidatus Micrarchaeota archaeon]
MQMLLTLPSSLGYGYIKTDEIDIGLESGRGDYLFVSHAHTDHVKPLKKRKLLASEFTANLVYKNSPEYHKSVKYYDAGHIIGSVQIQIETPEGRVGYTGDLKPKTRGKIKGAQTMGCEYLIIESTYARSIHPSYEKVVEDFGNYLKRKNGTKLIGAYKIGKAQEVNMILNEEGITPIVSPSIAKINEIYPEKLDYVVAGTQESQEMVKKEYVAILPPSKITRELANELSTAFNEKVYTIGMTAQPWAIAKYDKTFAISDHADQQELVDYVETVNPKMVLTTHGDDLFLANLLRKRGFNAIPYSKLKR